MKRITSLVTATALAGSLVGTASQAQSTLYLVPISDLSATYAPGAKVTFAAVMDLGSGAFSAFSVPTALAYLTSEFGAAKPTAVYNTTADPLNPAAPFWNLVTPVYYATTASLIGGVKVQTIQPTAGHAAVSGTSGLLPVPAGTYTIATFTFPLTASSTGTSTVYLPTPFGYTNNAFTADGAFHGVSAATTIEGSDVNGNRVSNTLTFPNTGGKHSSLTFNLSHSEMYLVPISDINATYAPGSTVQVAAVLNLGSGAFSAFTVPTALAYITSEFGPKPTALYDTTPDPTSPGNPFWNLNAPVAYATTASLIGGVKVQTIQPTAGHAAVSGASGPLTVAAGIYTIATFSLPIASSNISGSATVSLPTPLGYTNSSLSADGAYQVGVGPLLTITGKDASGALISDQLTFPNSGLKHNSLTFNVTPAASLSGTLQFNDIVSFASSQNVTFQFRDPASSAVLYTQTATVPVSGVFTLAPVPVQAYTLWIKPDKFLARTAPVAVSGKGFAPVTVRAFNGGDANNDNSVDTSDFGILVGAYGGSATVPGSGYDPRADFNGDSVVDPSDFGILVDSYGQKGEL